jgi:glutaredoxin
MNKKIFFLLIVVFSVIALASCGEPQDGKYAAAAKCLTEKGVKLYGAFWCPHCQEQKALFGDDQRYLDYVECDERDPKANVKECTARKIERFPTWFFPGQGLEIGLRTPEELAKKAGCEAALTQQSTQAQTQSTTSTTQSAQ